MDRFNSITLDFRNIRRIEVIVESGAGLVKKILFHKSAYDSTMVFFAYFAP